MDLVSKILAPTDCSEESCSALNYAIKIARKNQAEVMVLYVVSSLRSAVSNVLFKKDGSNEIAVKNQLEELWKSLDENEVDADLVVGYGDPFTEIINCAKSQKNDVIVMGTSGRTGLTHVVMGSVAEKVVRYSPIPVLIVKNETNEIPGFPQNFDYEYDLHKLY